MPPDRMRPPIPPDALPNHRELLREPGHVSATRMADALPIGVAAVDATGRQSYVNEAFERLVGWPRAELVGAVAPFVYWPEDQRDAIQRAFELTLAGRAPADGFTLVFQRRDGVRVEVLVHLGPVGGHSDGREGWTAAVLDISRQVALQRAVTENEQTIRAAYAAELAARRTAERSTRRLEALQRATSELTATLTPEQVADVVMRAAIPAVHGARGSVALVNDAADTLEVIASAGYSAAAIDGYRSVPLDARFPLADAARTRQALLLPTTAARAERYPHLRALLEENGAGAMASLPLLAGGRVLGVIGINWREDHEFDADETAFLESLAQQCAQALERARLYEEERRARSAAEEANRAKSSFLAAMSHELRTPLNAIAGYVDLLELGVRGELSPEQRLDLERIRINQRHLASLVEDVLSFARIEAGKLEVERTPFPVDAMLRALQPMVAAQLSARSVRLRYTACDDGVSAVGDRERTAQICINLLMNAAKASATGGEIRLGCEIEADRVLIRVSDDGVGIPADKLEAIFSPFTQLGRSLNAPRAGTGLGLSISRGLAEAMGGTLMVESAVGVGSTFTVALPRA